MACCPLDAISWGWFLFFAFYQGLPPLIFQGAPLGLESERNLRYLRAPQDGVLTIGCYFAGLVFVFRVYQGLPPLISGRPFGLESERKLRYLRAPQDSLLTIGNYFEGLALFSRFTRSGRPFVWGPSGRRCRSIHLPRVFATVSLSGCLSSSFPMRHINSLSGSISFGLMVARSFRVPLYGSPFDCLENMTPKGRASDSGPFKDPGTRCLTDE